MVITVQITIGNGHGTESYAQVGRFRVPSGALLKQHVDAVGEETRHNKIQIAVIIHVRLRHGA